MKIIKKKIYKLCSNLKLKTKFLTLFIICFTLLFVFSIIIFSNLLNNYNKNLYITMKTTLDLSSNNIEESLDELVDSSHELVTNHKLQDYLRVINEDSAYKGYTASLEVDDMLNEALFNMGLATSIHIIYNNHSQSYFSKDIYKLDLTTIKTIQEASSEMQGKVYWLNPTESDSAIILARQIRDMDNLTLKPLGTLIIRIQPKNLVQRIDNNNIDNHIMIISDKKIIYNHKDDFSLGDITPKVYDDSKYHIMKINGHKYFIALQKSRYSDWYYVNYMLYDNVIRDTVISRNIMFVLFIIIIIIIYIAINWIVLGMIKPIESLSDKMLIVEQGNFNIVQPDKLRALENGDEIAHLEYDFYIMIDKINDLINENYKKQLDIKRFQFKALQAQINPHFLYNTLDSVFCLAKINKQDKIASMIKSLSNLLRKSISDQATIVTIHEELNLLLDYINIQQFRFEERLQIYMNVHESIKKSKIPKLTLQPIVENAINYGLELKPSVCHINIHSILGKDSFSIIIQDNGSGMSDELIKQLDEGSIKAKGSGIGIKNINGRIRNLYGKTYGLSFKSTEGEGTTAIIRLPYNYEEELGTE